MISTSIHRVKSVEVEPAKMMAYGDENKFCFTSQVTIRTETDELVSITLFSDVKAALENMPSKRELALEDTLKGCKAFLLLGEQAPRNANPEEDDLKLGFDEGDVEAQIEEIDDALKGGAA